MAQKCPCYLIVGGFLEGERLIGGKRQAKGLDSALVVDSALRMRVLFP